MKVEDANSRALQIFAEESHYPTVGYKPIPSPTTGPVDVTERLVQALKIQEAHDALTANRSESPRTVLQGAHRFQVHSQNYNLLVTLLGRVEDMDRSAFLQTAADRIKVFPTSVLSRVKDTTAKTGPPTRPCGERSPKDWRHGLLRTLTPAQRLSQRSRVSATANPWLFGRDSAKAHSE
jgi:hypothetical protein